MTRIFSRNGWMPTDTRHLPGSVRETASQPLAMVRVEIAPGIVLWREKLDRAAQSALLDAVFARIELAPFYRPVMPKSGAPFSVEETNFGSLGWVSDREGYRYAQDPSGDGQAVAGYSASLARTLG